MDDELTSAEYALYLFMDGVQQHEMHEITGHDKEHCAFIWAAYERVCAAVKAGATLPKVPS